MPELPDVEIFRKYAHDHALNRKIKKVVYNDDKILRVSKQKLSSNLKDQNFTDSARRGKYVFLRSSSEKWLVVHFGMTGYFQYYSGEDDEPEYARVIFVFSDDHNLACISKRKLGKIDLAEDPESYCKEHDIGKDAYESSEEEFRKALSGKKGNVKSALMDQSALSGIGNIYADEILYQTGISPEKNISDLNDKDLNHLHKTLQRVFRTSINHNADPDDLPRDYLLPHRKEGEDCPKCKGKIKKTKINGRSTYYCPSCQT